MLPFISCFQCSGRCVSDEDRSTSKLVEVWALPRTIFIRASATSPTRGQTTTPSRSWTTAASPPRRSTSKRLPTTQEHAVFEESLTGLQAPGRGTSHLTDHDGHDQTCFLSTVYSLSQAMKEVGVQHGLFCRSGQHCCGHRACYPCEQSKADKGAALRSEPWFPLKPLRLYVWRFIWT